MVVRSTALSSLEDGVMSGLQNGTGRCGNAGRESGPGIPLNGGNFAVRSRLVHMGSHVPEDERDALCVKKQRNGVNGDDEKKGRKQ